LGIAALVVLFAVQGVGYAGGMVASSEDTSIQSENPLPVGKLTLCGSSPYNEANRLSPQTRPKFYSNAGLSSAVTSSLPDVPEGTPRYLMGMGAPQDLWEAVERGVDMMDCVWPTRIARNGQVMTLDGRMNIKNTPFQKDFAPLDPECSCPVCRRYSRAYLSHLFRARELSAHRLLTIHNVHFNLSLMRRIREAILRGTFRGEKTRFFSRYFARTG